MNLVVVVAAPGCGNTVIEIKPGEGGGGAGGGATTTTSSTTDWDASSDGKDALPDYVDPGCPDAPPAMTDFQCDPYNQNNGDCAFGEGCYIYVQYPQEACEQEIVLSHFGEGFGDHRLLIDVEIDGDVEFFAGCHQGFDVFARRDWCATRDCQPRPTMANFAKPSRGPNHGDHERLVA